MWEAIHSIYFSCKFLFTKYIKRLLKKLNYQIWLKIWFSVKVGFHILQITWIETLISEVAEETRLYLFNKNESLNFNFVMMVIEKDVSHHD